MNTQTPHTLMNSFGLFADMINHINKLADNPWRVGNCYNCGNLCTGYVLPTIDQDDQVLRVICRECLHTMPEDFLVINGIKDLICPTCGQLDSTGFVKHFAQCASCDHMSANP